MKKIFRILVNSALVLSLGSSVFFYKIWTLSREKEEKSKLEIQALTEKNSELQELIKLIKESEKRNEGILRTWSKDQSKIADSSRETIFKIMQAQSGKSLSRKGLDEKKQNWEEKSSGAGELAEKKAAFSREALAEADLIKLKKEKTHPKLRKTYEKKNENNYATKKKLLNGRNEKNDQGLSGQKNFWQAEFSQAEFSQAELSQAKLSQAELSQAELSQAELSQAELSQAELSQAKLSQAELSQAELSQAELSQAELFQAEFSQAKLDFEVNIDSLLPLSLSEPLLLRWQKACGEDNLSSRASSSTAP